MLRIVIDAKRVLNSLLIWNNKNKAIDDLPEKLKGDVIKMLYVFKNNHDTEVIYDEESFTIHSEFILRRNARFLKQMNRHQERKLDSQQFETILLLAWYFGPHIYSPQEDPRKVKEHLVCADCGRPQMLEFEDKCQFANCLSHEKWARVIEGYKPVTDIVKRVFSGLQVAPLIDQARSTTPTKVVWLSPELADKK